MSTEAMKLALEALEFNDRRFDIDNYPDKGTTRSVGQEAITALREALAQPQQEPVDFVSLLREAEEIVQGKPTWNRFIAATPLANDIAVWMTVFAQDVARRDAPLPSQRKPLTDEEIETVWRSVQANDFHDCVKPFARAIEAKHNIKENT